MAAIKMVDGKAVQMTAREEAALATTRANWTPPPRMIAKSVIVDRLIAAGLIDAAYAALASSPRQMARWFSPGAAYIAADNQEALDLLAAIGADPDVIMGP